MSWKMKSIVLLIGLPMLGVCATAFYLLHRKEEDDIEKALESVKTSRLTTVEITIPKASVGVVIGRGGSTIKEIQESSHAKINFKGEELDDVRICVIRGTPEATQIAEQQIREIIMNQPVIEICEIFVPQRACGRIIGRCGENIRVISRTSNAKINVDDSGGGNERKITIKGTIEQISIAKSLIQEKVEEDANARLKMEISQAKRSPKNNLSEPTNNIPSPPSHAEVLSPRSTELDRLVDEMTTYYSKEENVKLHKINELNIGQVVAATYKFDSKWYRAEVKTIEVNEHDQSENQVDLYYVDYGDKACKKQNELMQLRTDFLSLRFQAIECNLANVKPIGSEDWSESSVECFEELCHLGQWKPLMAKVVNVNEKQRGHREGSPVPTVDLYDTTGTTDINIAQEMVKRGFAQYIEENKDITSLVNGNSSEYLATNDNKRNYTKCYPASTDNIIFRPGGESDSNDDEDDPWSSV